MIEAAFELIVQLILEVVSQVVFELAASLGWASLRDGMRSERTSHPVLAPIGQFLLGVFAGILSLLIVSHRIWSSSPLPGISLLVSPMWTGVVMYSLGNMWPESRGEKPGLFSFWGGATFAFGMALTRFIYIEDPWQWWPR